MTLTVLIVLGLLPHHLCCTGMFNFSETAHKVSSFIDLMGWTKVTVICSPSDRPSLALSVKIARMSHAVIQTKIVNSSVDLVHPTRLIILVPPTLTDTGELKSWLNPVKAAAAYTSLIISEDSVWKSSVDVPLGVYYLNLHHCNDITKVVLTRRRDDPASFESRESSSLSPFSMEGAYLHVVTMPYKPYLEMNKCLPNKPCEEISGFTFELLQAVATEANFTMSVFMHEPQEWGTVPRIIDGVARPATGIIKSVLEGQTDLPLSVWIPTSFRFLYLDFTFPFHYMRYKCFANVDQVYHNFPS